MLVATGSASSCQNGQRRLDPAAARQRAAAGSRAPRSSSPRSATASRARTPGRGRCAGRSVTPRPSWFAMCSAWRFARSHEMPPSPPPANAPCRCCMTVCIIAGSMSMPDSRESCSGSSSPPAAAEQLPDQLLELLLGTAVRRLPLQPPFSRVMTSRSTLVARIHRTSRHGPFTLTPVANDQAEKGPPWRCSTRTSPSRPRRGGGMSRAHGRGHLGARGRAGRAARSSRSCRRPT